MPYQRLIPTCTFALLSMAGLAALAGEADPPELQMRLDREALAGSTLTRAEVTAEVLQARADGMLLAAGEIADTPHVLAARERFNVAQTKEIVERYARIEEMNAARARLAAAQAAAPAAVTAAAPVMPQPILTERADGTPIVDDVAAAPQQADADADAAADEPAAPAPGNDMPGRNQPAPAAPDPAAVVNERRD